jgi:hypothetical protein
MSIQNRMQHKPGMVVDYDILGLQAQRRQQLAQQSTKEDAMQTYDIFFSHELERRAPRLERKEPSAFEALVSRLLSHSIPMSDEELARRVDAALKPLPDDASIDTLVQALTEGGVFASARSAMCDRINRFNDHQQRMEATQQRDLAARWYRPSFSMY